MESVKFLYDNWYKDAQGSYTVYPNGYNSDENRYSFFPYHNYGEHVTLKQLNHHDLFIYLIQPIILNKPILFRRSTVERIRKNNNIIVVFYFAFEGYYEGKFFKLIEDCINYLNIEKNRVFYVSGDLASDHVNTSQNYNIIGHWLFPLLENDYPRMWKTIDHNEIDPHRKRSKHFLCLNRNRRPHRNYLAAKLVADTNLWDKTYLSYGNDKENPSLLEGEELCKKDDDWDKLVENLCRFDPIRLDMSKHDLVKNDRMIDQRLVFNSYFNIVTESQIEISEKNPKYVFITEKTLKPIAWMQPFIVIGNAGTLDILRKKGFYTFPEIFDESYDLCEDPRDRIHMIEAEIRRIAAKPIDEIHTLYNQVWDKLVYNRNVLWNYPIEHEADNLFWKIHSIYKAGHR